MGVDRYPTPLMESLIGKTLQGNPDVVREEEALRELSREEEQTPVQHLELEFPVEQGNRPKAYSQAWSRPHLQLKDSSAIQPEKL